MAKRKKNLETHAPSATRGLIWALLAGVWALAVIAVASHDPADWPGEAIHPRNAQPTNLIGQFGAVVSHRLYEMAGLGVWVILAGFGVLLGVLAIKRSVTQAVIRCIGLVVMGAAVSGLAQGTQGSWHQLNIAQPIGAGGLLGNFIWTELFTRFNVLGANIVLLVGFWVGAVLAADRIVLAIPRAIGRMFGFAASFKPKPKKKSARLRRKAGPSLWTRLTALIPWPRRAKADAGAAEDDAEDYEYEEAEDEDYEAEEPDAEGDVIEEPAEHYVPPIRSHHANSKVIEREEDEEDDELPGAPEAYTAEKRFDPEALREKIKQLPINFAPKLKAGSAPPREVDLSGYEFPPLSLLEEPESNFTDEMERLVRDQAVTLEAALQQYRIEGEVVGIDTGPVITLFEVRLAPGTKVSTINNVASDIARALKAQNIRVVPNMAGKDTVGIEVPNLRKERVRLKELMTAKPETARKMMLPMYLGKDASGNPLIGDLTAMPHMLIAGTTGSGKSVCMNSIIMSFLFTKRPDDLRLVLVDPKMVEMSQFKDVPHLMCPVVTEMEKATSILEWAVTKMDERYELLAEAGVRDIAGYNALEWEELKERLEITSDEEALRVPKKLPYMVFVIDELADMMMTNKEVEGFIVRIAQKARAVGIHLILATQRPQANVVTGLIKSNMPCRISFKVASGMDSRIVLDQKGAELLLGQGDMLFLSPRTSKLTRAQGSLIDDIEIRRTVKFLKKQVEQNFEPQLVQVGGPSFEDDGERDPLFNEAVSVVLESQRGSVSLLQRRLTIGYSRASRLIEQIAMAGIIGEYKGSQAREVNMTLEEWEAIRAQMEADAARAAAEAGESAAEEQSAHAQDGDEADEEAPWDEEDQSDEEDSYEEDEADEDEYEDDEAYDEAKSPARK